MITTSRSETGLVPKRVANLRPSPENDSIYRPVSVDDPEIHELAKSIREHGLLEPIVITRDGYILSGHRRHAACRVAGLRTVNCRVEDFSRRDEPEKFLQRLREHNRQREKSISEKLREEIVSADPTEARRALVADRRLRSKVELSAFDIRGSMQRSRISQAKRPFLDAILDVLQERKEFLPISVRAIHYALLNRVVLRHASKPDSIYRNDVRSYKSLDELLTRARVCGLISNDCICDPTRPVTIWGVHADPQPFIRRQLDRFLKGYYRDLLQSQPNHVEIVGEKNTVDPILSEVAADYCLPMTTGRGYSSLPPRSQMAQRYWDSGKKKLVLLIVSDFDPDGEEICQSFARSMRDDFEIDDIHPIKVALTAQQARDLDLPPSLEAKKSSSNYKKFADKYGDAAYELESLEPKKLQDLLRDAIESVLDMDAFHAEQTLEGNDAVRLRAIRESLLEQLGDLEFEE